MTSCSYYWGNLLLYFAVLILVLALSVLAGYMLHVWEGRVFNLMTCCWDSVLKMRQVSTVQTEFLSLCMVTASQTQGRHRWQNRDNQLAAWGYSEELAEGGAAPGRAPECWVISPGTDMPTCAWHAAVLSGVCCGTVVKIFHQQVNPSECLGDCDAHCRI